MCDYYFATQGVSETVMPTLWFFPVGDVLSAANALMLDSMVIYEYSSQAIYIL